MHTEIIIDKFAIDHHNCIIQQNTHLLIGMLLQHRLYDCNQEYERSMCSLLALTLFHDIVPWPRYSALAKVCTSTSNGTCFMEIFNFLIFLYLILLDKNIYQMMKILAVYRQPEHLLKSTDRHILCPIYH